MLCQKGQKIMLCTQYRYIWCCVKRVERLCIFAHNFLNTQLIFNPKKVLTLPTIPSNAMYVESCQNGQKLFWPLTPLTWFNICMIIVVLIVANVIMKFTSAINSEIITMTTRTAITDTGRALHLVVWLERSKSQLSKTFLDWKSVEY